MATQDDDDAVDGVRGDAAVNVCVCVCVCVLCVACRMTALRATASPHGLFNTPGNDRKMPP